MNPFRKGISYPKRSFFCKEIVMKLKLRNFLFSFTLVLNTLIICAQQEIKIDLKWNAAPEKLAFPQGEILCPNLENSFIGGHEFLYIQEFKRGNRNVQWDFSLATYQTTEISQLDKDFIAQFSIPVYNQLTYKVSNISKEGIPVAVLSLVPYIRINDEVKRIVAVNFNLQTNTLIKNKSYAFAANSVLQEGSGDWYKISVDADGIYKIDYIFLKSIGIDVDHIHPDDINIYGNGFGRLPEQNSISRPDDLLKNDILVVGGEDGVFNTNDYILFYGKGPNKWELVGDRFERNLNVYNTTSIYFINVNPSGSPARIQNAILSNQPANQIVTSYNSYAIHEKEFINIFRTGKRWYGEEFDVNLTQNFSLNIPQLNPNEPAVLRGFMACKIGSTGGTTNFKVSYNNTNLATIGMPLANKSSITRGGFTTTPGQFNPTSSTFSVKVTFNRVTPSDVGYLDFLEVNARSYMKYYDGVEFRDLNSVGVGNVAEMQLTDFPSNGVIWETTNPTQPKLVTGTDNGGIYSFKVDADSLRSFVAFKSKFGTPKFVKRVSHQNLHGLEQADYLIVTHPRFLSQANRLADLHRSNGLKVHVVTSEEVYNEFSSGMQDPTAIKFFAKMFYDRAGGNITDQPKYFLLFGDGTFDPLDRVPNNNNMIVMYETDDSENYTGSIVSDDYFGFLDDGEGFSPVDVLDIAVGRLIATTEKDAVNFVNKIELYMKNGSNAFSSNKLCGEDGVISTHGNWRLNYAVIADDEENGYFLNPDMEPITNYVETNHPEMNVKKIYLDAYQQITTAGGERYPEVNNQIQKSFEAGKIVICYNGHGGATGAASERVMTIGEMRSLTNIDKLTLFVSATCEFARVDDNERVSIGEWMILNEVGGAIAMMTTTRAVYFSTNTATSSNLFKNVFMRDANNEPLTFGEIILKTKNAVTGGSNNKRCFMLLGDPALKIALPYSKVVLDSVNGNDVGLTIDTLSALGGAKMKGHIEDQYGNILTNFNGFVQPTIYDKPAQKKTLGQNVESPVIDFYTQENVLFSGKSTVKDGYFNFEFIVPKDIDFNYGKGKASFYAWSTDNRNGGGYSKSLYVGGIDTNGVNDSQGPQIDLYLNSPDFVNGGITDETPVLIAKIFDESGINTVGNGIGHDLTLIIDNKASQAKVLNEFYTTDLDTYKSGQLRYQLEKLAPGRHTLSLKAWDINNNSNEKVLEFIVQEKTEIAMDHVLNYPNPFTTHTEFMFEHNQTCSVLDTKIEIYTVSGRLVKTINQAVETRGYRVAGIPWDGRDEYGDQLARGVYIYRISIKNPDGESTQEMQKLYLLK